MLFGGSLAGRVRPYLCTPRCQLICFTLFRCSKREAWPWPWPCRRNRGPRSFGPIHTPMPTLVLRIMIMTPPSRLPLLAFIGVFLLFTSTVSLCSAHVFDNPLSWEQRFRAPTETVASTCAQASAWNTHLAALSCLAPQRRKRHLEMHQAHCGVSATRWSQMTQKGPSSLCKLNAAKC